MFFLTNFTRNEISEAAPPVVSCPASCRYWQHCWSKLDYKETSFCPLNSPNRSRPFELNVL